MKRIATFAVLAAGLSAATATAQQLMAWPIGNAPGIWHGFPPRDPLPFPRPLPQPRPQIPAPEFPPEAAPVAMSGLRVDGTVDDRVAELTYRITFRNPGDRRLEGVLMVPIPAETQLSGFSMTVGGKETKGELLDATQAASIYEGIVRRQRDPGLLELVGERMFRARVFPIEPRGEVVATLKLTQTVPQDGGMATLRVPLRGARMGAGLDGRASARVVLKTEQPLRGLFSSNPEVRVERRGEREAVATYEEGAAGPQDLTLTYSLRRDPLAAGVLAYREEGEDGTFMLSLSPKAQGSETRNAPKSVVFVLDRSGSMADDGKLEQAKKALSYCVSRLGPDDRFAIVDFATDWNALEDRLLPADDANKARARRYISGLEAGGGTNIEAALGEGLRLLGDHDSRVPMIFFLTDGVPTQGQTDVNALLGRVAAENAGVRARLFSFGVGSDVNTLLLDKLADSGQGARDYVAPGENIEAKVSSLYQKVSRPALTDVRLEWRGVETAEVYPRPVPDLFYGSELTLYGRYKDGGAGTLVVTGRSGGKDVRFEYPVQLPKTQTRHSFLPRLWAGQKVARELDALRMSGRPADPETAASIVKLAKKYGIVTPYTSFLVTEEGADGRVAQEAGRQRFEALSMDAAASGFSGGARVGKSAQVASMTLRALAFNAVSAVRGAGDAGGLAIAPAAALQASESAARAELKKAGHEAVETRTIGDKTFYRRGRAWVDSDAETEAARSAKTAQVRAGSPEYFELLAKAPELARWFALGNDVTVLWRGTVCRVISAP